MRTWPSTLHSLGLEISTGPLVPFRATSFLRADANGPSRVPLLWMQHVRPMRTDWPSAGAGKPQWVEITEESMKLLVEDATYVLMRRFSAKEEKRRLVAAPLIRGSLNANVVGLENHLNYIRGVSRELDEELAYGLSALLNSTFLDRYFRISNGNTQVSATELRAMPLPAERDIRSIGAEVQARLDAGPELPGLDGLVAETLNLSPEGSEESIIEKAKASVKSKVAHPFLKVKRQFGYTESLPPSTIGGTLPGFGQEHATSGTAVRTGQPADGGGSTGDVCALCGRPELALWPAQDPNGTVRDETQETECSPATPGLRFSLPSPLRQTQSRPNRSLFRISLVSGCGNQTDS